MSYWEKFRENLRKFRDAILGPKEQRAIVSSTASLFQISGEPYKKDLSKFENFYREDPVVRAAIDFLTEMIVGVGYYTTCEDERAKEIVDKFAEKVNLDGILINAVRSMLIYGDAYIEKVFNGKRIESLVLIPSKTMKVQRNEHGKVIGYIQRVGGQTVEFQPEEIMHLSYCQLPGEAYGISLLEPCLTMLEQKKKSITAMGKILNRYAAPKIIWTATNENVAKRLKEVLDNLEPDEDPIIPAEGISWQVLTIDPRARFEFFYDYLDRQIFEGLKAPLLSWLRNATEASAKVMLEAIERHVAGIQRYVKRKVEAEIFRPLIEAEGLSEVPRLNWGMPRTKLDDLTLDDIANLVKNMVINSDQAQVWLKKLGFPLEEAEEKEGED